MVDSEARELNAPHQDLTDEDLEQVVAGKGYMLYKQLVIAK